MDVIVLLALTVRQRGRFPQYTPVDIDMMRVVKMHASDRAKLIPSLARRCSPVVLLGRPPRYQFQTFEGAGTYWSARVSRDRYWGWSSPSAGPGDTLVARVPTSRTTTLASGRLVVGVLVRFVDSMHRGAP